MYEIALFLFCINIAFSLVTSFNVFGYYSIESDQSPLTNIQTDIESGDWNQTGVSEEPADYSWVDIGTGLSLLVSAVAYATVGVYWLFAKFLGYGLALLISLPIYVIYAVGLVQIFLGRNIKEME
jgi:hypothetical protein